MESLSLMVIGISLVSICAAVAITLYAHKAYALITTLTLTIQIVALVAMLDATIMSGLLASEYVWIFVAIFFVGTYFTLKVLYWLWLWWCFTLAAWLLLFSVLDTETLVSSIKVLLGLVAVVGIVGTILMRHYARVVVVSVAAGMNLYTGIAILLIPVLFLDSIQTWGYVNLFVMLAGVGAALYYHLKMDRRLLEKYSDSSAPSVQQS